MTCSGAAPAANPTDASSTTPASAKSKAKARAKPKPKAAAQVSEVKAKTIDDVKNEMSIALSGNFAYP